jgi:hypothetical protein
MKNQQTVRDNFFNKMTSSKQSKHSLFKYVQHSLFKLKNYRFFELDTQCCQIRISNIRYLDQGDQIWRIFAHWTVF